MKQKKLIWALTILFALIFLIWFNFVRKDWSYARTEDFRFLHPGWRIEVETATNNTSRSDKRYVLVEKKTGRREVLVSFSQLQPHIDGIEDPDALMEYAWLIRIIDADLRLKRGRIVMDEAFFKPEIIDRIGLVPHAHRDENGDWVGRYLAGFPARGDEGAYFSCKLIEERISSKGELEGYEIKDLPEEIRRDLTDHMNFLMMRNPWY